MRMTCYNCGYSYIRYNADGRISGVDCAKDNLRFVPDDSIHNCGACANWVEKED